MWKQRSYKKELLDETGIPADWLFQNLRELQLINSRLGGHAVSLKGLAKVVTNRTTTYSLTDLGCGGGDSLRAMADWAKRTGHRVQFTGVDLKKDCIAYAMAHCRDFHNIDFICDDFRNAFRDDRKIDMVHAALFCHHFTERDIVAFLQLCSRNKAIFIINDLERNPIAWYAIKWLTALFSKSHLVKNDAPLSVLRGFRKKEWKHMLETAGIKKYDISNRWAFRHLIMVYPND